MTKHRYNQTEREAIAACEAIKANGSGSFRIVWVKSRTWGHNPNVKYNGYTVGKASGCGYDKESAALADFLRFLAPDGNVYAASGAGFGAVVRVLDEAGWTLEKTYSGKSEDGYSITRK